MERAAATEHRTHDTERSAAGKWRDKDNQCATANSAAVTAFAAGVFKTKTPRSVAASTSMLSTPLPARPTTRKRGALLITRQGGPGPTPDQDA